MTGRRASFDSRSFFAAPALLTLWALTGNAVAQNVRVLDATNGPYFTLQAAVNAAASGDIILVEPGGYPDGASVVAKSISILAVDATQTTRVGPLRVEDLSAEQDVVFRGIEFSRFAAPPNFVGNAVVLDNAGTISFVDCLFPDSLVTGQGVARPAVRIDGGGGSVMFSRCTVEGPVGLPSLGLGIPGLTAGEGITVKGQDLYLFDSVVTGGRGGTSEPGADAIVLDGAGLTITGGSVTGGGGGWTSSSASCSNGGDGGGGVAGSSLGIELYAATDLGVDANVLGGDGGVSLNGNCQPGNPGAGISATGTVVYHGGYATSTTADPGVAQSGDVVTMSFAGPDLPGGSAWFLYVSTGIEPSPLPPLGIEVLPTPVLLGAYAFTGPTGSVPITAFLSPTGGNEGTVLTVQSYHVHPLSPNPYLGAYTHVAVIRPGFDPN